jgi:hypothetical protein
MLQFCSYRVIGLETLKRRLRLKYLNYQIGNAKKALRNFKEYIEKFFGQL